MAWQQSQSMALGDTPDPASQLAPSPAAGPAIGPGPEAPTTPGAPGGIPPKLLAALTEAAKKKHLRV